MSASAWKRPSLTVVWLTSIHLEVPASVFARRVRTPPSVELEDLDTKDRAVRQVRGPFERDVAADDGRRGVDGHVRGRGREEMRPADKEADRRDADAHPEEGPEPADEGRRWPEQAEPGEQAADDRDIVLGHGALEKDGDVAGPGVEEERPLGFPCSPVDRPSVVKRGVALGHRRALTIELDRDRGEEEVATPSGRPQDERGSEEAGQEGQAQQHAEDARRVPEDHGDGSRDRDERPEDQDERGLGERARRRARRESPRVAC